MVKANRRAIRDLMDQTVMSECSLALIYVRALAYRTSQARLLSEVNRLAERTHSSTFARSYKEEKI